jgi:hypothetical protein
MYRFALFAATLAAQDSPILPQRPAFNGGGQAADYVIDDPAQARQGRDAQLEKAIAVAMEALAKSPSRKPAEPAYPNYAK